MGMSMRVNPDGTIILRQETQTFNQGTGSMDIEVHGEMTMSAREWLNTMGELLRVIATQPSLA